MTFSREKEFLMPVEFLRALFEVTPCGKLIHKSQRYKGIEAGTMGEKYRRVLIRGRLYLTHRVIYAITHGAWPDGFIDHIDTDKTNNRPENLRVVTASGNSQNRRSAAITNKSGLLGVSSMENGYFRAAIGVNGKKIELGYFKTPEAAHAAYLRAKRKYHESCTI